MKTISAPLKDHLAGETTTLATCWRLTRRDGVVMGFTDHDADIVYDGVTYQAATGYTGSAVRTSSGLAVDNLDVAGLLDAAAITQADIEAGKYDYAEVNVFAINWADTSMGILKLVRGRLGEVQRKGQLFVAELRSLAQALQQTLGELYAVTCRATLGDARCGVNTAALTVAGTVTAVTDRARFTDSARAAPADTFTWGLLTFASGANEGYAMEVKSHAAGGAFTLVQPLPYAISVGDAYEVYPGCDRRLETCKAKFSNVVNFRGEPYIPGVDKLLEYPDAH